MIDEPTVRVFPGSGEVLGANTAWSERRIAHLEGVFEKEDVRRGLDPDLLVYRVVVHKGVEEGTEGGLYFGTSFVEPGFVGDEYFMTKGHFHKKRDRAEYYWGIRGRGILLLMEESRHCRAEQVIPGSLHYIPGRVAHRLVNTGGEVLAVGACWPSDAGYDYESIALDGFSARVKSIAGKPTLVEKESS